MSQSKFNKLHKKFLLFGMISKLDKMKEHSLQIGFTQIYIETAKHLNLTLMSKTHATLPNRSSERIDYKLAI